MTPFQVANLPKNSDALRAVQNHGDQPLVADEKELECG